MTPWTVAIVAETTEGDVVLRMTEEQAVRLRDGLVEITKEES
jgi:hypothetical protein